MPIPIPYGGIPIPVGCILIPEGGIPIPDGGIPIPDGGMPIPEGGIKGFDCIGGYPPYIWGPKFPCAIRDCNPCINIAESGIP